MRSEFKIVLFSLLAVLFVVSATDSVFSQRQKPTEVPVTRESVRRFKKYGVYSADKAEDVVFRTSDGKAQHFGCSWRYIRDVVEPDSGDLLYYECRWNDSRFDKLFFLWSGEDEKFTLEHKKAYLNGQLYGIFCDGTNAELQHEPHPSVRYLELSCALSEEAVALLGQTFPNVNLINVRVPAAAISAAKLCSTLDIEYVHWGFMPEIDPGTCNLNLFLKPLVNVPEQQTNAVREFHSNVGDRYQPRFLTLTACDSDVALLIAEKHISRLKGLMCHSPIEPLILAEFLHKAPQLTALLTYQPCDLSPVKEVLAAASLKYLMVNPSDEVEFDLSQTEVFGTTRLDQLEPSKAIVDLYCPNDGVQDRRLADFPSLRRLTIGLAVFENGTPVSPYLKYIRCLQLRIRDQQGLKWLVQSVRILNAGAVFLSTNVVNLLLSKDRASKLEVLQVYGVFFEERLRLLRTTYEVLVLSVMPEEGYQEVILPDLWSKDGVVRSKKLYYFAHDLSGPPFMPFTLCNYYSSCNYNRRSVDNKTWQPVLEERESQAEGQK